MEKCDFFSSALIESWDVPDTVQPLTFVPGITKDFEVTAQLSSMEAKVLVRREIGTFDKSRTEIGTFVSYYKPGGLDLEVQEVS